MKDKSIVVIASNQVSINLLYGIEEINYWSFPVTVFYHESRCSLLPSLNAESSFQFIPYSKRALLIFFFKKRCNINLFIPHFKVGKLLRILSFLVDQIGIIDDGLDTFRNHPNNVDLNLFDKNVEYITFDYQLPLGKWLDSINTKKLANVKWLDTSIKKKIDLTDKFAVLVEAPHVHHIVDKYDISQENIFAIRHSNPLKNDKNFTYINQCNGIDIAIENSLKSFNGHLFIGATMVLVSIIHNKVIPKKISLILSKNEFNNYEPLVNAILNLDSELEIIKT
jgi:hypothetical protein